MRKEKIRATDFSNRERPKDRLHQFGDIFKHRFLELIKLSLLQAIFLMPLSVSFVLFWIFIKQASATNNPNAVFTVVMFQALSFLISIPVLYIGLTGVFFCLKKMAYAEGEYAASSFFIGLKEEWARGLVIGILPAVSAFLALFGGFMSYIYLPSINTVLAGLAFAILIIQFLLIYMHSYYCLGQITVYSNKMRFVYKNAMIMMLLRFPYNLLFIIVHPCIYVASLLIIDISMYVGVVLFMFTCVFGHLIWVLNVLGAFDKYINKENNLEIYRKGLRPLEDKEG